ncbi:class I SAM-dependent methyltransferase [Metabacillus arenae]|uniref:Class I SAM-dependent methyltransferase n=1 Tax=Metabacillus arenae TaxID=2771434 RepID=A0A926ND20_9BACI|nr:class I SAM-dependent methyltransferase [Metabacillus arenae]MBD1378986.1 class I SAM-dependent methyltransferase [Metabacillus arenae]
MKNFWEDVISHILKEANAKKIVEIGSATGANTLKLLEYCNNNDGQLVSIDPAPAFDYVSLEKQNKVFKLMKDISLKALPKIKEYDAVLIDGDHNWYTVYHELKLIEKHAEKNGKFPIVFLHDVEWPYARRDMYYSPETIPAEFKKPYAKRGILKGQSKLREVENIGFNYKLNNAIFEGGEKNGVLTAIEDFLKESAIICRFYKIKPHCGLGILINDKKVEILLEKIIKSYEDN